MVFIFELKEIILKTDLNSLSKFFRDNNRTLHKNWKHILSLYDNFKVTNTQLQQIREQYFIDLAKKKLDDSSSVWEIDQLDPLNLYKKEKERLENIIKKEIALYQNQVQEIDKNYQVSKKNYQVQLKYCTTIKNKIEEYIESKSAYEGVFEMLKTEKYNTTLSRKYPDYNKKPYTSPTKKCIYLIKN